MTYHPALEHLELQLKQGVNNILYASELNRRIFPDFHIAWLKSNTMGMILKPSYNNNDRNNGSDTIESGTDPCNNGNCFHCHHMVKTRYIQFTKNGR